MIILNGIYQDTSWMSMGIDEGSECDLVFFFFGDDDRSKFFGRCNDLKLKLIAANAHYSASSFDMSYTRLLVVFFVLHVEIPSRDDLYIYW